ncbi:MAG: hypothetical protein KBS35_03040 [Mycoplasma sp.]|nr:hypothetical protein [Candidatus Hennigella equi]
MKLKNKLIPLTTIAAGIAAVTPLTVLSSCVSGVTEIKGMQEPTFEKLTGQSSITASAATAAYAKFAKEQPENFKTDYTWGVYKNWMSFFDDSNFRQRSYDEYEGWHVRSRKGKINSIKFGMSKPTFSSFKIGEPGKKKLDYPTISFKVKLSVDADLTIMDGYAQSQTADADQSINHKIKFDVEADYKNMVYFAYTTQRQGKAKADEAANADVTYSDPHWWITFASDSWEQYAYRNAHGLDWGIKVKGGYTDNVVVKSLTLGELSNQTMSGKLNTKIDNYSDFENLVYYKNYDANWSGWFNPTGENFPLLLLANAVLMDNESYYLSNLAPTPEIEADSRLSDYFKYGEEGRTESGNYNVSGWLYQPHTKVVDIAPNISLIAKNKNGETIKSPINLPENGDLEYSNHYLVYDNDRGFVAPESTQKLNLRITPDSTTGKIKLTPDITVSDYIGGKIPFYMETSLVTLGGGTPAFLSDPDGITPVEDDYILNNRSISFNLPSEYTYYFVIGDEMDNPYQIYPMNDGYRIEILNQGIRPIGR